MNEIQSVYYPQSEIHTTLIPVTTGCPYNRCAFCSMYKADTYSEVSLREIEHELMNGEGYTERVFLTGADPLSVGFEKIFKILNLVRKYFPVLWMRGGICICPQSAKIQCSGIKTAS